MAEDGLERRRCREHGVEIDAGRDAQPVEEIEQILGREIAQGAWRVRTSAESARGGIERRDSEVERREDVRQCGASRVMKMERDSIARDRACERGEHAADLSRMRDADRVADRYFEDAEVQEARREIDHTRERHGAFERATECSR